MASTDQAIGMMDAAYFTGRKEILQWINATLALGITKIESTCTGAIACQLIDAHFPNNSKRNFSCPMLSLLIVTESRRLVLLLSSNVESKLGS